MHWLSPTVTSGMFYQIQRCASHCAIFRSGINLRKHPVSILRGFLNLSALERVTQLQRRDQWNSAGAKFAVYLGEVSTLESVHLERVDCISILKASPDCLFIIRLPGRSTSRVPAGPPSPSPNHHICLPSPTSPCPHGELPSLSEGNREGRVYCGWLVLCNSVLPHRYPVLLGHDWETMQLMWILVLWLTYLVIVWILDIRFSTCIFHNFSR